MMGRRGKKLRKEMRKERQKPTPPRIETPYGKLNPRSHSYLYSLLNSSFCVKRPYKTQYSTQNVSELCRPRGSPLSGKLQITLTSSVMVSFKKNIMFVWNKYSCLDGLLLEHSQKCDLYPALYEVHHSSILSVIEMGQCD